MNHFELAPEEWATLRRLLDEALKRPQPQRGSWVEQLGAQFDAFKPRLHSLLARAAEATGVLPMGTLPKVETAHFLADRERADGGCEQDGAGLEAGAAVGPYRLIRPLGEGGMGAVWLAERTDMLHKRQLALKLPRLVTGRARLAERLAREREILAALNHPNIARLYDAGISSDGQPYLALEYIEGERIDAYCTRRQLDVPARLRLFIQVAQAVAHAHANLVVHRDLKPTNILVTEAGEVRLLDFGIAKLLDDGRAQETELTQFAGRALTPDYAAPEQVLGQPIGTAADVYALGIVLFELLAGQRPYKLARDSRAALEEAIVQADVQRPSTVAIDTKLKRRLRGDLDTIVLKALKKKPDERYRSVEALSQDIERHLERRPVLAQPDSRWYRTQKFLGRNRWAVGGVAAVMVAIVAGAGAVAWQARIAGEQRDAALRERKNAEEVKSFVVNIFRNANPQSQTGKALTAVDLLKLAHQRIDQIDPKRVEVRVELLGMLGDSLLILEEATAAEPILKQAIGESTAALGPEHKLTLWAKSMLSQSYRRQSRPVEMRAVLEEIVPVLRRRQAELPNQFLSALVSMANLSNGDYRFDDARNFVVEGLHLADTRFAGRHVNKSLLLTLQSSLLAKSGERDRALASAEGAVRLALELHKNDAGHAMVLNARANLATALAAAGHTSRGMSEHLSVLADTERAFGGRTRTYGLRLGGAAMTFARAGVLREALAFSQESVDILLRYQGSDSRVIANAYEARGRVLLAARRSDEAAGELTAALRVFEKELGAGHEVVRFVRHQRALALARAGRIGEALADVAETPLPSLALGIDEYVEASVGRAILMRLAGRTNEAHKTLKALDAELARHARPLARSDELRIAVERELVRIDLASSLPLVGTVPKVLRSLDESRVPVSPDEADVMLGAARIEYAYGNFEQSKALAAAALAFWRTAESGTRFEGEAALWLARSYAAVGRIEEAREAYQRADQRLSGSRFPGDGRLLALARREM